MTRSWKYFKWILHIGEFKISMYFYYFPLYRKSSSQTLNSEKIIISELIFHALKFYSSSHSEPRIALYDSCIFISFILWYPPFTGNKKKSKWDHYYNILFLYQCIFLEADMRCECQKDIIILDTRLWYRWVSVHNK